MATGAALFGKLPAHGDFVTRGMAAAERDALDDWLAGSIADARQALGDGFEDAYDQAPPWRYAVRGPDGWQAGAMAPSVDGVGRRYPILAGLTGVADDAVEPVAEAVEGLLYDALGGGWDADRLAAALGECAPEPVSTADGHWTGGERWWTLGCGIGTGWVFFEDQVIGARPPRLMRSVLAMQEEAA